MKSSNAADLLTLLLNHSEAVLIVCKASSNVTFMSAFTKGRGLSIYLRLILTFRVDIYIHDHFILDQHKERMRNISKNNNNYIT